VFAPHRWFAPRQGQIDAFPFFPGFKLLLFFFNGRFQFLAEGIQQLPHPRALFRIERSQLLEQLLNRPLTPQVFYPYRFNILCRLNLLNFLKKIVANALDYSVSMLPGEYPHSSLKRTFHPHA